MSDPVDYYLSTDGGEIRLNDLIHRRITLRYQHEIHCLRCGRKIPKSFVQGYCYPCFSTAPETEECVLRPELCRAHEGVARDMAYAETHCLIDHYVYLSYTSGIKVGVTRNTQVPVRWIDQGATAALPIARTPNRYLAGCIEVALKSRYADKTNWRTMLQPLAPAPDLSAEVQHALQHLPVELQVYGLTSEQALQLNYPVYQKLPKIVSLTLDKQEELSDTLVGIKGQYLLFAGGGVFNVRKHGGYRIQLEA